MTINEAKKMMEAKLKCVERDVSGIDDDCNNHRCDDCLLNYEQGNMGEQKEWLRMSIEALEREQKFLDAGYKNGRVEFMIGGRKFMVKEMAQ